MPKRTSEAATRHRGQAGGPQPYRGTNYAINYAVQEALDLIGWPTYEPTVRAALTVEPRIFDIDGVTTWDLSVHTPVKLVELKRAPERRDVLEFIERIRDATSTGEEREFRLVYSSRTPLIDTLRDLNGIALEANDQADFDKRLTALQDGDADIILKTLAQPPFTLFRRILAWHEDEARLRECAIKNSSILAGSPSQGRRLFDHLSARFHEAGAKRVTFYADDIANLIAELGIELIRVPHIDLNNQTANTVRLLLSMQACRSGMPVEVAKSLLSNNEHEVTHFLEELRGENLVFLDGTMLRLAPRPYRWRHSDSANALADCLRLMLAHIDAHHTSPDLYDMIRSAADLAKECQNTHRELVWDVFPKLDKYVKQIGNKDLTIEVARVSLQAARRPPRFKESLRPEGLCLICGTSWVHQRRYELEAAVRDAQRALQIADDTADTELKAYCLKCTGRLLRIRAEHRSTPENSRQELLEQSREKLTCAIDEFPKLTHFPQARRDREVGECHSLLARTLLVLGHYKDAESHAATADKLLTRANMRGNTKEFCDLLILRGDIAFRQNDLELALSWYDDAIENIPTGGATESEIEARAYFQRGLARKVRRPNDAKGDLRKAANIWQALDESENSDLAAWKYELIDASEDDDDILHILEVESPSVRVRSLRRFRELRSAALAVSGAKRRGQLDLDSLARQAVEHGKVLTLLEVIPKD